jgi:hypothetical protein
MNLLIQPQQFQPSSIFFLDTKQNMMMVGNFTKMNYSTNYFTMIGLYLAFPILLADAFLYQQKTEAISYRNSFQKGIHPIANHQSETKCSAYVHDNKWSNKNLLYYYPNQNAELLNQIANVEYEILLYYKNACHIEHLTPSYHFYNKPLETLECIKYYREYSSLQSMKRENPKYYLKISGIWENEREYGITYKIVEYNTTQNSHK